MPTVMPHSELVRRAVEWIMTHQKENKDKPLHSIIDEAGMRFNLTPLETENLIQFLKKEK